MASVSTRLSPQESNILTLFACFIFLLWGWRCINRFNRAIALYAAHLTKKLAEIKGLGDNIEYFDHATLAHQTSIKHNRNTSPAVVVKTLYVPYVIHSVSAVPDDGGSIEISLWSAAPCRVFILQDVNIAALKQDLPYSSFHSTPPAPLRRHGAGGVSILNMSAGGASDWPTSFFASVCQGVVAVSRDTSGGGVDEVLTVPIVDILRSRRTSNGSSGASESAPLVLLVVPVQPAAASSGNRFAVHAGLARLMSYTSNSSGNTKKTPATGRPTGDIELGTVAGNTGQSDAHSSTTLLTPMADGSSPVEPSVNEGDDCGTNTPTTHTIVTNGAEVHSVDALLCGMYVLFAQKLSFVHLSALHEARSGTRTGELTPPSNPIIKGANKYDQVASGNPVTLYSPADHGELLYCTSSGSLYSPHEMFGQKDCSTDQECVVCLTEPKEVILLPCRHFCVCRVCFPRIDKCPICRGLFDTYMTTKARQSHTQYFITGIPAYNSNSDRAGSSGKKTD